MKGRTDIQRRTEREKNERGSGIFVFLILISHLLHYTTLYCVIRSVVITEYACVCIS